MPPSPFPRTYLIHERAFHSNQGDRRRMNFHDLSQIRNPRVIRTFRVERRKDHIRSFIDKDSSSFLPSR